MDKKNATFLGTVIVPFCSQNSNIQYTKLIRTNCSLKIGKTINVLSNNKLVMANQKRLS